MHAYIFFISRDGTQIGFSFPLHKGKGRRTVVRFLLPVQYFLKAT